VLSSQTKGWTHLSFMSCAVVTERPWTGCNDSVSLLPGWSNRVSQGLENVVAPIR